MAAFVSPGAVSGVGAIRPHPQPPDPVVAATGSGKTIPRPRAGLDVPGILAAVGCGSLIIVVAASFTGVTGASAAPATLAARVPPTVGTRAGIDVLLIALFVAAGSAALTLSLRQREPALFGRLTGRTVVGLAFLVGADALIVALFRTSASQQLGQLLTLLASVALLGPVLVAAAGLALAGARARPRAMAPAVIPVIPVIPVALGVVFAGTVYFVGATIDHASLVQARQRLDATEVVTAPGRGLTPAAVGAIARRPGVTAAAGLTPVPVAVGGPGLGPVAGEVVTGGDLTRVLDLGVTSGSLRGFGPGDIAVSQQQAQSGMLGVRVGEMVTVHLPGGVGYRARVTAIYRRSLGFGDVVVPAAAAAGRLGSASVGQILVRGGTRAGLAARFPRLQVAGTRAVNARARQLDATGGVTGDLLLGMIALLAAATLASALVTAAAGPRPAAAGTAAAGLGIAVGTITLVTVSRAVTGGWPYLPPGPSAVIGGSVLALGLTAAVSRPARPRSAAPVRPAG